MPLCPQRGRGLSPRLRRRLLDPAVAVAEMRMTRPSGGRPQRPCAGGIPVALALGPAGDRRRAVAHAAASWHRYEATRLPDPWRYRRRRPSVSRSLQFAQHGCRPPHQAVQFRLSGSQPLQHAAVEGLPASRRPRHAPTGSGAVNGKRWGCVHFVPTPNGTVSMPIAPPEPTPAQQASPSASKR